MEKNWSTHYKWEEEEEHFFISWTKLNIMLRKKSSVWDYGNQLNPSFCIKVWFESKLFPGGLEKLRSWQGNNKQ